MFMMIQKKNISLYCLWMLGVVYGLFSSMIPSVFGLPEIFVGLLLTGITLKGIGLAFLSPRVVAGYELEDELLKYVFIFLLFAPTMSGIFNQNDMVDVYRDIIPLFFFFIPFFIKNKLRSDPVIWVKVLSYILSLVGVFMAIRHFFSSDALVSELGDRPIFVAEGISLGHDPSVLFAAIFLLGLSVFYLSKGYVLRGLISILLSIPVVAVILAVVARGPFVFLGVSLIFIFFRLAFDKRFGLKTAVVGFVILALVVYFKSDVFLNVIDLLILKQENHGNTIRYLELIAVYDYVTINLNSFLFGGGWGALLPHPLANGGYWSFVHNMWGYFLFKTGFFGVVFLVFYVYWFLKACLYSFFNSDVYGFIVLVALVPSLLLNSFFEVGYKTIPFGLLLCLLVALYYVYKEQKISSI